MRKDTPQLSLRGAKRRGNLLNQRTLRTCHQIVSLEDTKEVPERRKNVAPGASPGQRIPIPTSPIGAAKISPRRLRSIGGSSRHGNRPPPARARYAKPRLCARPVAKQCALQVAERHVSAVRVSASLTCDWSDYLCILSRRETGMPAPVKSFQRS